jgi:hypothetical protein
MGVISLLEYELPWRRTNFSCNSDRMGKADL